MQWAALKIYPANRIFMAIVPPMAIPAMVPSYSNRREKHKNNRKQLSKLISDTNLNNLQSGSHWKQRL